MGLSQSFRKQAFNVASLMRYAPDAAQAELFANFGSLLERLPALKFRPYNLQAAIIDAAVRKANIPLVTESALLLEDLRLSKNLIKQIDNALRQLMRRGVAIDIPTRHLDLYYETIRKQLPKILREESFYTAFLEDPSLIRELPEWTRLYGYTIDPEIMLVIPTWKDLRRLAQPVIIGAGKSLLHEFRINPMKTILHEFAHPITRVLQTKEPLYSWQRQLPSSITPSTKDLVEFITEAIASTATERALTNYIEQKALDFTLLGDFLRKSISDMHRGEYRYLSNILPEHYIPTPPSQTGKKLLPKFLESKQRQLASIIDNLSKLSDIYDPPKMHRILRKFFENIENPANILKSVAARNPEAAKGLEEAWGILLGP